jgi:hypothetical protein
MNEFLPAALAALAIDTLRAPIPPTNRETQQWNTKK